ncbi:hypothetical protein MBLNU230_g2079t1 [Neophaeotheca triangularis]
MAPSPSTAPSTSSSSSSSSSSSKRPPPDLDPISRTALRYTLSPREYELLHQYLATRVPRRVRKSVPEPGRYARIVRARGPEGREKVGDREGGYGGKKASVYASEEFVGDSVRLALRVFGGVFAGLKGWEVVLRKLAERRGGSAVVVGGEGKKGCRHGNFRTAGSLASILLVYRLLYRFFVRLGWKLQETGDEAAAFRKRNPNVTAWLSSPSTPAIGAAVSGALLGITPAGQLRLTVTIYALARGLEFSYNALALSGRLWGPDQRNKPHWFGAWLIMPFACGQLLHAFVFDRDCFNASYARTILRFSPTYIQARPSGYNARTPWPETFDIVDALAELSRLRWPAFLSPILFPSKPHPPPNLQTPSLVKIAPLTSTAHPAISRTSCALLHPHDPSCAKTYLTHLLTTFPPTTKFFTLIYTAFALLLSWRKLLSAPLPTLNALAARILRMSLFLTTSIGTAWASICLFANFLPPKTLPTRRWFLGGFLGGLFAYLPGDVEAGTWLYSFRVSAECAWKVAAKRGVFGRGKGEGLDVGFFVLALAVIGGVYQGRPEAVSGGAVRKALGVLRGEGWVDRVSAVAGGVGEKGAPAPRLHWQENLHDSEMRHRHRKFAALNLIPIGIGFLLDTTATRLANKSSEKNPGVMTALSCADVGELATTPQTLRDRSPDSESLLE